MTRRHDPSPPGTGPSPRPEDAARPGHRRSGGAHEHPVRCRWPLVAARLAALGALTVAVTGCAVYRMLPGVAPPAAPPPATASDPPPLTREQAVASLAAARGLIDRRDYPSARGSLRAVVPAAERAGWLDIDSDAHFIVGETLDRERASREAADAYERAYSASRRLGDRARDIRNLNALTNALLDAGAHERATAIAAEAYGLAHAAADVRGEATAQNNIAEAHRLAGRLDDARVGYERALALARQSGDQAAIASILINLGSTERRAGRLADARARFAEAQDLARHLNDRQAGEYVEWHLNQIEAELSTRRGAP
jgi:tetratricopeptide (TPR) repeat protein